MFRAMGDDEDSFQSLAEWRGRLHHADEQVSAREDSAREAGDQTELDDVAATRDMISAEWDELARRHDAWAQRRDLEALDRDKRASDRDVAARRLADDGDTGFANRWHSAGDRDDGGGDRADSFDDRRHGAEARDRAADDRDQASTDRVAAADQAAGSARELEQVRDAVATRGVIGQALGLLMARHGLSTDEAFALLSRQSQATNTKLRDLAVTLVSEAQPTS